MLQKIKHFFFGKPEAQQPAAPYKIEAPVVAKPAQVVEKTAQAKKPSAKKPAAQTTKKPPTKKKPTKPKAPKAKV